MDLLVCIQSYAPILLPGLGVQRYILLSMMEKATQSMKTLNQRPLSI